MLIFDLETDGLLKELTTIHCLAIYDTETDEINSYNDQTLSEPIHTGINRLVDADSIAGHNIIYFDLPAINRIYSWFNPPDNIVDTLLLSRLYHSDQMRRD